MATAAPRSPRTPRTTRTQSERRQGTMGLLIEATIGCLNDLGYAHTSTQAIALRAGLSQGAIFRHFPTRQDLMVATAEALAVRFLQAYRERLAQAQVATEHRIDAAMRALADVTSTPDQVAWFELQMASRTDLALSEAFRPIFLRCQDDCIALGQSLLPDLLGTLPFAGEAIQLLIHVFHGIQLDAHIEQNPQKAAQMLAFTTAIAKVALSTASQVMPAATPRAR